MTASALFCHQKMPLCSLLNSGAEQLSTCVSWSDAGQPVRQAGHKVISCAGMDIIRRVVEADLPPGFWPHALPQQVSHDLVLQQMVSLQVS